jgi:hypothetical protein
MRSRIVSFPHTRKGECEAFHDGGFLQATQSRPRPLDQKALLLPALSANAVTIGFGRLAKDLSFSNLTFLGHDVAVH